ncbi:MAG: hypothetical protein FWH08_03485 [Oscillospiraceae bacterium]|nr:hypothetical protein [Oscillospiraceae bacterium]
MRSSFAGLEMSKRTIQIAQKSLDIATGNMANIMTDGYTRQRIDTNSMYLKSYKNWQTKTSKLSLGGQGVNAFGVAQVRDPYLDKRFREMNSYLAEQVVKQPVLEELQTTIDFYENMGMDQVLAAFKDSLSKYATNSANLPDLATNVRADALNITRMLNSYARDFDKLLEDNVFELGVTVDYVNTLVEKVVSLNNAIVKEYKSTEFGNIDTGRGVSPYGPLELIDERNLVLDELSGYINIRVDENVDGSINLQMGGVLMIDGNKFEHLVMQDFDSFNAAVISASNGQSFDFRGGEIKARMELVNGNGPYANSFQDSSYGIPYYRSAIDAFAESFANLMNSTNGVTDNDSIRAMFGSSLDVYDVEGNIVERGPITASTIRISNEWMEDPLIIGRNHSFIEGNTSINFDELTAGSTYSLDIRIGGTVTETFTFTAIPVQIEDPPGSGTMVDTDEIDRAATIDALNAQITDRFGSNGHNLIDDSTIVVAMGGLIANVIDNRPVTVTPDAAFPAGGLTYHDEIIRQQATANLDGTNPNKLLMALDDEIKFGRALDFSGTVFDYVSFISNTRLGQGLKFIDEQRETLLVTTNNLLDSRDAISGVSNDEEGINMLIYQKWYNAAARMMTALDECLDRIINGMGRVGL